MRTTVAVLVSAFAVQAATLTYTEKTQITQASGILKFALKLGGQSGPQETIHRFSDGIMSTETKDTRTIWDTKTQIITTENLKKNECSEITFDEMSEAIRLSMARLQEGKSKEGKPDIKMNYKVDIQRPGIKEKIAGVDTDLVIITIIPEAQDQNNQQGPVAVGKVTIKSYMGNMPGGEVALDVQRKIAEKMVMDRNAVALQALAGAAEGLRKAYEELGKLGQTPMRTVLQLAGASSGESTSSSSQASESQSSRDKAAESVLGLGGRLGRLGRKKPKEEPQAAPAPASTTAASGETVLFETTSEVVSYSKDFPLGLLAKTPGCKAVEHPMKKALERQKR
jgi:hypothetical protein